MRAFHDRTSYMFVNDVVVSRLGFCEKLNPGFQPRS
jgi:hypothetical protein